VPTFAHECAEARQRGGGSRDSVTPPNAAFERVDALLLGRLGLRPLVPLQTTEAGNLESVLLEYGRGTRGSASAVSSGQDSLVLR
jgi:hypothetical protein